jgi:hypothetical protein
MPSLFLTSAAKGRRIVFWTLACFTIGQLGLSLYLDKRHLEIRDPVYGFRLHSLQARLADAPNAPLFLILGSSRVKYGVWPGAMKVDVCSGRGPVIYNFGIDAMGPIRALMYLRRLLADGICPDWLLVEVWPPLWTEADIFQEARQVPIEDDLHWYDLPLVWRYFLTDPDVVRQGLRNSLLPISAFRSQLVGTVARILLSDNQAAELARHIHDWQPGDSGGWFPMPEVWKVNTAQRRLGIERQARQMESLMNTLVITPQSEAAQRELLEECRRHGIQVALILLPEHSRTRSWYSPRVHAMVRDYLGRLHQEFGVPIVDVRNWVPDADFADDYVHMQSQGVPQFSERLGREVVGPLMQGVPLDSRVLFIEDEGCPIRARSAAE